jgi:hypothetical protein
VFRLRGIDNGAAAKIQWMAKHVSACYPAPLPGNATDEEKSSQASYEAKITQYMTHACSAAVNGCKDKHGICSRGYMTRVPTTQNTIDETGFPSYARPTQRDLLVVPHNRDILMDWDGHVNLEVACSSFCVLYLYKYLYKGNTKITVHLENTSDLNPLDEINHYIRGRMMCSMEG